MAGLLSGKRSVRSASCGMSESFHRACKYGAIYRGTEVVNARSTASNATCAACSQRSRVGRDSLERGRPGPHGLRVAAISRRPIGADEPQNVVLSSVFGRYADRRLMIAALGTVPGPKHLERARPLIPEPIDRRRGHRAG